MTAPEIFNKLHEFVKKYDADGQAELFAEQGVWEFPFATGNLPRRIEGRENIRAFGKMGMESSRKSGRQIVDYENLRVHHTTDINTVIVEFDLKGKVAAQNFHYTIPYIQLLEIRNGEIVLLRDYFPMEILKSILAAGVH